MALLVQGSDSRQNDVRHSGMTDYFPLVAAIAVLATQPVL